MPSEKRRRIRTGDIVRMKVGSKRLGVVAYAPYSNEVCQVLWPRRVNSDILTTDKLLLVLTKREATEVRGLRFG